MSFSIVYGTNIWSHHQAPVAKALAKYLGEDRFRMALFKSVGDDRRQMGWSGDSHCDWVVGPPKSSADAQHLMRVCLETDVMVFGACPMEILDARAANGKLTFVSSERLIKQSGHSLRLLNPRHIMWARRYRKRVNYPHIHALSIGHYAPSDMKRIRIFNNRIWRWGYFVEMNSQPPAPIQNRPLRLLWVGRMLHWKRVDLLLRAVALLRCSDRFDYCTIVGDGLEKNRLKRLASRLKLGPDQIRFLPPVPFREVRRLMRESDIYVLPSDLREGWGAVAGEAFSEGCVLVANEQAGAARELIDHGKTGYLFRNGDVGQLASLLNYLAHNFQERMEIRMNAWQRGNELWHPHVAAKRLIALCRGLLGLEAIPEYPWGPCARLTWPPHERSPVQQDD